MDAVERLRLADGSGACWLRLTDECSGAILGTAAFPEFDWGKVPPQQTQAAIRRCFERYGCPGALRADNGTPWGTAGRMPSALSLWLAGLGVRVHFNDPYRPQQNGVVERTQGVSQRWAEPDRCANFAELCERLEQEDVNQRERYPAVDGQSRWRAYPALLHSGRGYCRRWEEMVWDLGQAWELLARFRLRRKVSRWGQVSMYHRLICFASGEALKRYAGSWVYVGFAGTSAEWVITDLEGRELHRRPAPHFSRDAITTLQISNS
jgi:transposase InsO family protein